LLGLPAAAALAAAGGAPARADLANTTDLALHCDTTLGPALRTVAAAYAARNGVNVNIFPTAPGLLLPQLQREVQNDVLVTQLPIMQRAAQAGIVASDTPLKPWRDRLVIAGLRDAPAVTPDTPVAVTDPSPAADMDSEMILLRMNLHSTPALGAIDTSGVAFLLTSGAARAGLLHMTDVRADPRLAVLQPVPDEFAPPLLYAAAVTKLSWRRNPAAFVAFLNGSEATALLAASGLEKAS